MQGCKDICPVLKIQKCCFLCDRISTCDQRCSEESNSLCELLIDIPDGNYTVVCCDGQINENGLGTITGNKVNVDEQSALILHD